MGYRWDCLTCNAPFTIYEQVRHVKGTFTCWSEKEKEKHQIENPTHKMYGGFEVYGREEDIKEHPNRKHREPSKRQGCPQCGKSEKIRYVSKGKLRCITCDIEFDKALKK